MIVFVAALQAAWRALKTTPALGDQGILYVGFRPWGLGFRGVAERCDDLSRLAQIARQCRSTVVSTCMLPFLP